MSGPVLVYAPIVGDPVHAYLRREIEHLAPVVVVGIVQALGEGSWRPSCPVLVAGAAELSDSPTADQVITNYSFIPEALKASFFSGEFQREVRSFIEVQRARAVYAQWLDHRLPLLEIAGSAGLPYAVRTHGTDICAGIHLPDVREKYRGYQRARAIFAGSNYARDHLIGIGLPPEKIVVAPFGIEPRSEPKRQATRARVLMVSRLAPIKGAMYALEGFRRAAELRPELSLDVVGSGPFAGAIAQLVDAYGLHDRIRLWGSASDDRVAELREQADIFLQASFEPPDLHHMETFGVSLLEAMAVGLPIVCCRTQAFPELVVDGETGILVPERDAAAIAQALVSMTDDISMRARMGKRGWERAREKYTFALQRERVLAALE